MTQPDAVLIRVTDVSLSPPPPDPRITTITTIRYHCPPSVITLARDVLLPTMELWMSFSQAPLIVSV